MRFKASRLLSGVALTLLAAACTPTPSDDTDAGPDDIPPPPYDSFDERPCPSDSVLTYENFGQGFVATWCTGCHHTNLDPELRAGAPGPVNFDDLDGVRGHADRMWARAGDQNNTMPPVGIPPEAERALLGEWLACGAKSIND